MRGGVGALGAADDQIDVKANQLGRQFLHALVTAVAEPLLDANRLAVDVSEVGQCDVQGGDEADLAFRLGGIDPQHADKRQPARLLRLGDARPSRRRARRQKKLAPPHSIPSSPEASGGGGNSR